METIEHDIPFADREIARTETVEQSASEPTADPDFMADTESTAGTLASVAQYDFRVSPQTPASRVYAEFQRDPMLPGCIVADGQKVLGLLSRQRFFQQLGQRFGASLFLDAPVQKILGMGHADYLVMDAETSIHDAAGRCLARPRDLVFDAILVMYGDGQSRLLGMHELLLAQSHQLTLANETIQGQIAAVEAASRAKGDFLANMSHEIRTPLNAIVGMTELLLDSNLAPRQREYAGTVIDSCENLMAIINDILDFSKIESGRLTLEQVAFDLREHLGDTLKGQAVRACRQGIELAFRCEADVPREVVGDPVRLRQVLVNLVGNAIKFTHQGEVLVYVGLATPSPSEGLAGSKWPAGGRAGLHFRVIDTGIGIPEDKLSMIFDAFEQADTSTTREYGGTGLGLAISRRLAKMMDGELWVESQVGRGSTFHFTAEVGVVDGEVPVTPGNGLAGKRVLVVDGHRTHRAILAENLASWRMDASMCASAAEAMSILEAAEANGIPFHLMILNAQLPDGSGFDLADIIGAHARLRNLPIIAITAADSSVAAEADRAGVCACLMKPVKHSELHRALGAALGLAAGEEGMPRGQERPDVELPPLRFLVGEDSLVNQKLICEILTRRGHAVQVASNGEEVLARLSQDRYDVILMDVQMPHMDGFETTRRIRQQSGHARSIPIVAMTAHALPDDRDRCLAAGMDVYVSKPIRVPVLMAAVASALGQRAPEPASDAGPKPEPQAADSRIDWNQVLRELDGNSHVLRIVVEAGLEEAPRLLGAIRAAEAAGDATALRIAAHTLKGAMRYFGKTAAFDEAFEIEKAASEGNFAAAAAALGRLESAVGLVVRNMQEYLQEYLQGDA
jgi:two-component system, sensor histidine kinase and response regulator